MEDLSYKLDQYEGPLDLLLTLIAKNKVNIIDISIAEMYLSSDSSSQKPTAVVFFSRRLMSD